MVLRGGGGDKGVIMGVVGVMRGLGNKGVDGDGGGYKGGVSGSNDDEGYGGGGDDDGVLVMMVMMMVVVMSMVMMLVIKVVMVTVCDSLWYLDYILHKTTMYPSPV